MSATKKGEELTHRETRYPERWRGGFGNLTPFQFMQRFSDEMDQLFNRLTDEFWLPERSFLRGRQEYFPLTTAAWSPAIEVLDRDDKIIVRADLPGIKPEDVKVELLNNGLCISGETKQEQEQEREGYYHSERSYGNFCRVIALPEGIKEDQVTANFNNGVLEVTMPQPEQRRRKQIQIQGEGKQGQVGVDTTKKSAKA